MSAGVLERMVEVIGLDDLDPSELLDSEPAPRVIHWVCHCTDHRVSACGRDVTGHPWEPADTDTPASPECEEAWPVGWTCPSGCACEDCWRAEDDAA